MAKVLLSFSMSLDGFVAGPDVSVGQPPEPASSFAGLRMPPDLRTGDGDRSTRPFACCPSG